jgi:hypothetical protein
MPERDYTNDYEDWLRNQPPPEQGRPEPPPIGGLAPPQAAPRSGPPYTLGNLPPPPAPGRQWILNPVSGEFEDVAVGGSPSNYTDTPSTRTDAPPPPPNPYYGNDPGSIPRIDMGGGDAPAFNWSQFNPSRLSFGAFTPRFGPFTAPTPESAADEPGYRFSSEQGRKALESSAAGRGILRTGGTLKDILEYGNKFAEQNYNNVFNRQYQTWQGNSDWDRANYITNRDTEFGVFDRNYLGEKDAFDALRRGEEMTFGDMYNRWRDKLNSLTQISTAGMD